MKSSDLNYHSQNFILKTITISDNDGFHLVPMFMDEDGDFYCVYCDEEHYLKDMQFKPMK